MTAALTLFPVDVPGLELAPVSATFTGGNTELADLLATAMGGHSRGSWWIGDLLMEAVRRTRNGTAQGEIVNGFTDLPYAQSRALQSEAYPPEQRRPELSWTHHAVVRRLPLEQRGRLLDEAVAGEWTVAELVEAMRREQATAAPSLPGLEQLPKPPTSSLRRALAEHPDGFVVWCPTTGDLVAVAPELGQRMFDQVRRLNRQEAA